MTTLAFVYQDPFPLEKDDTEYRLLTRDHVSLARFDGKDILKIEPEALTLVANEAMRDVSFLLRTAHLKKVAAILKDPQASDNDRFVAMAMLRNAETSAKGILPFCQDTGTAIVIGKRTESVLTGGQDEESLARGIFNAYQDLNLRYSQMAPLNFWEERNTGSNLPAQIELFNKPGTDPFYELLFMAKGGGSANKTFLYQETKALLNPTRLGRFLEEKLRSLGTAACPPYHLAIVVGGMSAEYNLKVAKLASARYLDELPREGSAAGHALRDVEMEQQVLEMTRQFGIGAQFGGKYFCHDVRVIRLPRHGASLPVGVAVSCSADRQAKAKITPEGVFLEQLERDPAKYLPEVSDEQLSDEVVKIDLNRPMTEIRSELSKLPVKTRVSLTGPLVVARDIAHAKIAERLDAGEPMPDRCTSAATDTRSDTTSSWRAVVPHRTTATGVSAARPCPISSSAMSITVLTGMANPTPAFAAVRPAVSSTVTATRASTAPIRG